MTRHPESLCKSKCTFALFFRMEGSGMSGAEWLIKGKWAKLTSNMYGVFEFLVHYLVHMVTLVFLYGKVINTSKKTLNKLESSTSAATQKVIFTSCMVHSYLPNVTVLSFFKLLNNTDTTECSWNIPGFVCRNKSCYRCYCPIHIDIQLDVLVNT